MIWVSAMLALLISAWLTHRFLDPASYFHMLDQPNERSLHSHAVPRSGGLAIVVGIMLGSAALSVWQTLPPPLLWFGSAALLIATVSFIDDRNPLPASLRLVMHGVAAAFVLGSSIAPRTLELAGASTMLPEAVSIILALLYIAWMINLYNFMDGMDGFAGGMTIFGFGTFAVLGMMAEHNIYMAANLVVVSAAAGFLVFNFPPARIFMGDVGSSTLGLLAAAFSLWGARDGVFPFWVAVLVFSPFIVDATVTLLRRFAQREKVWHAHKTHYYQCLVQAGWGHRKTLILEYAIMLGCSLTAVWVAHAAASAQVFALAGWAVIYACLFFWITQHAGTRQ